MKKTDLKIIAAAALACAAFFPGNLRAAGAAADAYSGISDEIARYADANGVNKIVMTDLAPEGGAEAGEAKYVSAKIAEYLSARTTPILIERSFFERILLEARASSPADKSPENIKKLQDVLSVDAFVSGSAVAVGGELKLMARLIDIKTGRVLFVTEAEIARETGKAFGDQAVGRRSGTYSLTAELPGILVPDGLSKADKMPSHPSDLRDAVADTGKDPARQEAGPCAARKRRLVRLNADLVDAKARYWADKMKAPGYGGPVPGENPGGEIEDPATRAGFYKLLTGYYKGGSVSLTAADKVAVEGLIGEEKLLFEDCGRK